MQRNRVVAFTKSDFVNRSMKILAFLMSCNESGTGTIGPFCFKKDAQLLITAKVRLDSLVFLATNLGDGIRIKTDGTILKTYETCLEEDLNSMTKEAVKFDDRLMSVRCFNDLGINYYPDPEDAYNEWMVFEARFAIPSPTTLYMRALDMEIKNHYPDVRISVNY